MFFFFRYFDKVVCYYQYSLPPSHYLNRLSINSYNFRVEIIFKGHWKVKNN